MAVYNMQTLPLKKGEVEERLKAGEEFFLLDTFPQKLYHYGEPHSEQKPVPIVFYPSGKVPDFKVSYITLPSAAKRIVGKEGIPEIFLYVPMWLLGTIPEDELRFMIAHEYMHTTNPNALYLSTAEMTFKEQKQSASSTKTGLFQLQADGFGLFTMLIRGKSKWQAIEVHSMVRARKVILIKEALSYTRLGSFRQGLIGGFIDSMSEAIYERVAEDLLEFEDVNGILNNPYED